MFNNDICKHKRASNQIYISNFEKFPNMKWARPSAILPWVNCLNKSRLRPRMTISGCPQNLSAAFGIVHKFDSKHFCVCKSHSQTAILIRIWFSCFLGLFFHLLTFMKSKLFQEWTCLVPVHFEVGKFLQLEKKGVTNRSRNIVLQYNISIIFKIYLWVRFKVATDGTFCANTTFV